MLMHRALQRPGAVPSGATLTLERPLVEAWKRGQIVEATVCARLSSGELAVRVGHDAVHAWTPLPLSVGQRIRLQVEALGPRPVFRVLG